jgi:hypothetical protein
MTLPNVTSVESGVKNDQVSSQKNGKKIGTFENGLRCKTYRKPGAARSRGCGTVEQDHPDNSVSVAHPEPEAQI